jgi:acyl-CoA thioester hydrolase
MIKTNQIFEYTFTIPETAVDQNGHVNNVFFVQWMQDVAVRHYGSLGGIEIAQAIGGTWVVREHHIIYLSPAFGGEEIVARTWVANVRRVRSLRRYEFVRKSDGKLLVKGETDWVFVNAKNGRPIAIPRAVSAVFTLLPDPEES